MRGYRASINLAKRYLLNKIIKKQLFEDIVLFLNYKMH